MNRLPGRVKELNAWILQNFYVIEGPARSYFELPFEATIGFAGARQTAQTYHRVAYLTLALQGLEGPCCRAIADALKHTVAEEMLLDATEPILIREWFSLERDPVGLQVHGRLAFWRPSLNDLLESHLLDCVS